MAQRAGSVASYQSRLEAGQFERPSVEKLTAIARALGVTLADLTSPADPLPPDVLENLARLTGNDRQLLNEVVATLLAFPPDSREDAIRGHRYEPLWRYLLATGVRLGEASGCRVEDVDEQKMSVRLYEAIAYVPTGLRADPRVWWERKSPKSARSRRTTPLTLPALAAIRSGVAQGKALRLAADKSWHDLGLVFPDNDGRPLREPKVLKAWDRMLAAAGLPKCRIHDLRHLVAHTALDGGAELLEVSRLLGHSTVAITGRIYSGAVQRGARRAAEAAARSFDADEAAT